MDAQRIRDAVSRYEGPLARYAARLLRDPERSRDLVQETFLRLVRKAPDDVEDHLAEWLFTVCRNLAMDEIRKQEKRMSPLSAELASRDPSPPQTAERREQASRAMAALERLPATQQEVLRLKFQNGLTYREISRVTNRTVSNVGVLIHTGLNTLRQQVPC